jgi:hypothetical protein
MNYIRCPKCGSQNRETDEKCYSCGSPLAGGMPEGAPVQTGPASPGSGGSPQKPPAVKWYVVYSVLMAIMYLLCAIGGAVLLSVDLSSLHLTKDVSEVKIQAIALLVVGFPLMLAFGVAPFLPRKPWNWIVGIALIGIGMTSCCCLPACIPLLIYWLKPETKAYFEGV